MRGYIAGQCCARSYHDNITGMDFIEYLDYITLGKFSFSPSYVIDEELFITCISYFASVEKDSFYGKKCFRHEYADTDKFVVVYYIDPSNGWQWTSQQILISELDSFDSTDNEDNC
jgi:hypothetical protein